MVLAFIGFYTSYILIIFQPTVWVIHIHFVLLTLWMIMLVAQPFLIKYKKLSTHLLLGKMSYVLVPLVLISGFLMMRFSYYRDIAQFKADRIAGLNQFSDEQILQLAAEYKGLPFVWFIWFTLFYILAIINRRRSSIHARYMVATALSLLGPIVDRVVFRFIKVGEGVRLEAVAFLIADITLVILLWIDYKNKRPTKTLLTALLIYIIGQVLYFTVPGTAAWEKFVSFVMRPSP